VFKKKLYVSQFGMSNKLNGQAPGLKFKALECPSLEDGWTKKYKKLINNFRQRNPPLFDFQRYFNSISLQTPIANKMPSCSRTQLSLAYNLLSADKNSEKCGGRRIRTAHPVLDA
jgi:hypothetical protein